MFMTQHQNFTDWFCTITEGKSTTELTKLLKAERSTINRWRRGSRFPQWKFLGAFVRVFNVDRELLEAMIKVGREARKQKAQSETKSESTQSKEPQIKTAKEISIDSQTEHNLDIEEQSDEAVTEMESPTGSQPSGGDNKEDEVNERLNVVKPLEKKSTPKANTQSKPKQKQVKTPLTKTTKKEESGFLKKVFWEWSFSKLFK